MTPPPDHARVITTHRPVGVEQLKELRGLNYGMLVSMRYERSRGVFGCRNPDCGAKLGSGSQGYPYCYKHLQEMYDAGVVDDVELCFIDECIRLKRYVATRYCNMHYQRFIKFGDPSIVKHAQHNSYTPTLITDRIDIKPNGCWEWTGRTSNKGYGQVDIDAKGRSAHRVSYEIFIGSISDNKHVLHKCDNPPCVNPEHLFIGTNIENVRDKVAKNRGAKGTDYSSARLNDDLVRQLRSRYDSGEKVSDLARQFDVDYKTMEKAVKRLTWKHVKD